MRDEIRRILESTYPKELVDALLSAFGDMQKEYARGNYKASELEGGQFNEAARRLLEIELFGTATPLGSPLNRFNDAELKRYESAAGPDSFRIIIPRVLYSAYTLRNKRGVGHLGHASPYYMDAVYVLCCYGWVLAEFVRAKSGLPAETCQEIVDSLVERQMPLVYVDDKVRRVLDTNMPARDQVIVLLYSTGTPLAEDDLLAWVEYSNPSTFRKNVLYTLHKERLIEYRDKVCRLTVKGVKAVEELLRNRALDPSCIR